MIQIAIMGLGTVGTGVAKVVAENARQIERKLGEPLQVKTILVRHFKDGPYRQLMTDDFTKIEEDHAIRVVVETIGGVEAAYEYTKRALNAGKHVVTANKQLVAEKGAELLALAKKRGVNYLFEASVGGGIPVLHPLTQCMAANRIDEVYGILNGTTNYILTRMVRAGTTFADARRRRVTRRQTPPQTWRASTPGGKSVSWRIWPSAVRWTRRMCPWRGSAGCLSGT